MGSTPDQVRADIERTRSELSADVDQLVDRTSPRRITRRRVGRAQAALRGARDRLMGVPSATMESAQQTGRSVRESAGDTAESAKHAAGQAVDAVQSAPQAAMRQTQGNPLAAGVIAFGGGLLAASLLPTSRPERQAGRQLREQAGDVAEPVRQAAADSARNVAEEAKETARESAERLQQSTVQAGQTTAESARQQAEQVGGQARDSARNVTDEARGRNEPQL